MDVSQSACFIAPASQETDEPTRQIDTDTQLPLLKHTSYTLFHTQCFIQSVFVLL